MYFLFLLFFVAVNGKNVFVSTPFDNFRIECPKKSAATELAIRLVESVGQKRQDTVFDLSCESVNQLFPWLNIPSGVAEIEREDCHYSTMIDPIIDEVSDYSCGEREYVAGIIRLADTRLQMMCCHLRTRDEFNCVEQSFNKPVGLTRSTVIEHEGQLINALRIDRRGYMVRFCDLAPRPISDIIADEKPSTTSSTSTNEPPSTTENSFATEKIDPLKLENEKIVKTTFAPDDFPTAPPEEQADRRSKDHELKGKKPKRRQRLHGAKTVESAIPLMEMPEQEEQRKEESSPAPEITEDPEVEPEAAIPSEAQEESQNKEESLPSPKAEEESPVEDAEASSSPPPIFSTEDESDKSNAESEPRQNAAIEAPTVSANPAIQPTQATEDQEKRVDEMISEIVRASSDKIKDELFKQSVTRLLDKENGGQEEQTSEAPSNEKQDESAAETDLSKVTFQNMEFPQPKEAAPPVNFSRDNLPLRTGVVANNVDGGYVFLKPVNANGPRRAPIRAYRPHVNLWDSDEEDDMGSFETMLGSEEDKYELPKQTLLASPPAPPPSSMLPKKKVIRKVIKKMRTPRPVPPIEDNFFSLDKVPKKGKPMKLIKEEIVETTLLYPEMTTTPSARRDLPTKRRTANQRENQADNAKDVDEDTVVSPFEEENDSQKASSKTKMKLNFREDENIEEVVKKLSVPHGNSRSASRTNYYSRYTRPRTIPGKRVGKIKHKNNTTLASSNEAKGTQIHQKIIQNQYSHFRNQSLRKSI
ncbi:hypothetical protein WR25_00484 isoform P [Diploscapter pachys]|uniref:Uncharacterized protein n=1 Tax=Diploscapter pachys TaxID=2018661 RepID=A0A2A2KJH7_9BILA|nr:hypothetical protein WR25_00484 isoform B [Diploscapter pachys]PAV74012.1 hypothetical protein WR25_00484 isoform P [Diploscapter pachys]